MTIQHIGLIPDGNRRWAKINNKTIEETYFCASQIITKFVITCAKLHISEISIYLSSKENLTRKVNDIIPVYEVIKTIIKNLLQIAEKYQIIIKCVGLENVTDKSIIEMAEKTENQTKDFNAFTLNLLIGYNPFDEIASVIERGKEVTLENLAVKTPVDLIIRTAGKPIRLSNFLPLQSGYANIEILDKFFIDLTSDDIFNIVEKYKNINPRYGK